MDEPGFNHEPQNIDRIPFFDISSLLFLEPFFDQTSRFKGLRAAVLNPRTSAMLFQF